MKNKNYRGFRDLKIYQLSYQLAVEIYNQTKKFPTEEKYSLSYQIRRSSRSIQKNISEAWSKRRYPKSFINKLTDSDAEVSETTFWLDFSKDHKYIEEEKHNYFISKYEEVAKILHSMINQPEKFCY